MNVTYHSHHGAITESKHVFIDAGLIPVLERLQKIRVHVFEVGFGTGLNALLTLAEADGRRQPVSYEAIELFPLQQQQADQLNYCGRIDREDLQPAFEALHCANWEQEAIISPWFTLRKHLADLQGFKPVHPIDLIYFDAFAPVAQPELWTAEIFSVLFEHLTIGGLLVTYCSKSDVRRAMKSVGFRVEKIQGPHGKREMVRAYK